MKQRYLTVSALIFGAGALVTAATSLSLASSSKHPFTKSSPVSAKADRSMSGLVARIGLGSVPNPSVASYVPGNRKYDLKRVNDARDYFRMLTLKKEAMADGEEAGTNAVEEKEAGGLDAMGAYLYWFTPRAFPNNKIDGTAYPRAVAQRNVMPPAMGGAKAAGFGGIGIQGLASGWQYIGPNNYSSIQGPNTGRINCIAYDPIVPSTFYVGAAGGGVWKTTDSGKTFTPLSDTWNFLNVTSIAIDPINTSNIYVGTGDLNLYPYSFGLMKSTNGGQTFTNMATAQLGGMTIMSVLVDPETPSIITVAAADYNNGGGSIWRSTNSGTTFTKVVDKSNNTLPNTEWQSASIGINDGNGNRFYYAVGQANGTSPGEFYRSSDRGKTWSKFLLPWNQANPMLPVVSVVCSSSPTNKDAVYIVAYSQSGTTVEKHVLKSADAGQGWTDITNGVDASADWSQAWYDIFLSVATYYDPNNFGLPQDIPFLGLIDLLQSPNEGFTWPSVGFVYTAKSVIHPDQHALTVHPTDSTTALLGNDGGLYRLNNISPGASNLKFTSLSNALAVTQVYRLAVSTSNPDQVMAGLQDNSTPNSFGDLANWLPVSGGDGGYCSIHPLNALIQTSSSQSSGGVLPINRTTDNWKTSSGIALTATGDLAAFMAPHVVDPNNTNVIYAGTNYLYKYDATTKAWSRRLGNTPGTPPGTKLSTLSAIGNIAVAPSDSTRVYTSSFDAEIWMSTDSGTSFTKIYDAKTDNTLPYRTTLGLSVNPTNPNDIVVTIAGSGTGHLYRCANTRAISRVWTDMSGKGSTKLPDITASTVERDPFDPNNTVYVGTDVGVFMCTNFTTGGANGPTWTNATNPLGLPNAIVNHLQAVYSPTTGQAYLYAGTYGRGIWRIHLTTPPVSLKVNSLTITPTTVTGGQTAAGAIKLNAPTGVGGTDVAVTVASTPASPVPTTVPAIVHIPDFTDNATFTISTNPIPADAKSTVTATLNSTSASASLTVLAIKPTNISVSPNPIAGGNTATGQVTLNLPAIGSGATVTLTSSSPTVASVPATVTVAAGSTSATFPVVTVPVGTFTTVTLTAVYNGTTVTTQLGITPVAAPSNFSISPNPANANSFAIGTLSLSAPAPTGGKYVLLSTSDTSVATVPATLYFPGGSVTKTFTITTKDIPVDKSITVVANDNGAISQASLQVRATVVNNVTITPQSVKGGQIVSILVQLSGPAAAGGSIVTLTSSDNLTLPVPATVTVPAGLYSKTIQVKSNGVAAATDVSVVGTLHSVSASGTVTVTK